ncbi:hypothetical protein R1sor_023397 [Riccia sorocarpa]|uniref:CCHC-type domain-containing protein n=1 Tax=Riccia sorocarpa TaxID=122646 RepID=A0ABD3GRJ0_9MARC
MKLLTVSMRQKIKFLRLPDACFQCRQRDHFARVCPLNQDRDMSGGNGGAGSTGREGVRPDRPNEKRNPQNNPGDRAVPLPTGPGQQTGINNAQGDFQQVQRRGKPKYHAPEIKKTMRVDNRYGILTEPEDDQTVVQEGDEHDWDVRSKRSVPQVQKRPGAKGNFAASSSSKPVDQEMDSNWQDNTLLVREVVNTTKEEAESIPLGTSGKMVDSKHQQEDRDKRLFSAGAVMPPDSSGRKKLRNGDNLEAKGRDLPSTSNAPTAHNEPGGPSKDFKGGNPELKAREFDLERTLSLMAEGGRTVIDYRNNGWGGAALVLRPNLPVINCRIKGDGHVAWAEVETDMGPVGVASIYAPQSETGRADLWRWLSGLVEDKRWILTGDMNMVEHA